MKQNPSTIMIVPTYNEAGNLPTLLEQLLALPVNLGVVVVDDNSPDKTGDIADQWAKKHKNRVSVIHRKGKLGLGTAYIAGFKHALKMPGVKNIMSMDADFSHNPKYIPAMVDMSKTRHIVIGSRYVPGGGSLNWPFKRVLLSKIANLVAKTALGLKAKDNTAGFRLYHREVLESIPLDSIFSNGYSFLVEMIFMCQRRGWQIGEVPIIFEDRVNGETKISRNEIYRAQYTILRLFFRRITFRAGYFKTKPVL